MLQHVAVGKEVEAVGVEGGAKADSDGRERDGGESVDAEGGGVRVRPVA